MEAIWCQNQTIDSTNISLCFVFDSLAINKIESAPGLVLDIPTYKVDFSDFEYVYKIFLSFIIS